MAAGFKLWESLVKRAFILAFILGAALPGSALAACGEQHRDARGGTVDVARSLHDSPRSGRELVYWIANLAITDDDKRKSIVDGISRANEVQKEAIGQGLAAAVGMCENRDASLRRKIEDMVRKAGDRTVLRAYLREFSATSISAGEKNEKEDWDKHQTLDLVGPIDPVNPNGPDPYPLPGRRWFVR